MQELEKILEGIENLHTKILNDEFACKVTEQEIIALVNAKDIIRKHMNDGWIPVEGKLPEGKALACDKYGEMMIGYICGNANGGYNCEDDSYEMFNVLAWRPLPEPYHPERSNNHDRE